MKRAFTTKAFTFFCILFILIAAVSFAAFRETKEVCSMANKCSQPSRSNKGGEILWDGFSRRFISLITVN